MNVKNLINDVLSNQFVKTEVLMKKFGCKLADSEDTYCLNQGDNIVYFFFHDESPYPSRVVVKQQYKAEPSKYTVKDTVLDCYVNRQEGRHQLDISYSYIDNRGGVIADSIINFFSKLNYRVCECCL